MSVQLSKPGQTLGRATTAVALLTSSDGRSWRPATLPRSTTPRSTSCWRFPAACWRWAQLPYRPPRRAKPEAGRGPSPACQRTSGPVGRESRSARPPSGAGAPASEPGTDGMPASTVLTRAVYRYGRRPARQQRYVVGHAGPQAVGWYSPDGSTWEAPQPLDTSPQLGTKLPQATCWAGSSAVVVGSATSTGRAGFPWPGSARTGLHG